MDKDKKYFIAFAGNIAAGKTTCAKIISDYSGFKLFKEPVVDNEFLAPYYKNKERWSFTLQMKFLYERTRHYRQVSSYNKSCVSDRSLIEDPEVFANYLHSVGHMNEDEYKLCLNIFRDYTRNIPNPDLIVYLEVDEVDILLERILKERGREFEQSIDKKFLEGLNGIYVSFPEICSKYDIDIITLDAQNIDFRKEKKILIESIEDKLK